MDDMIERAQHGDSRAFASLFEQHKSLLWKTAMGVLGNPTDAADALQETALRAWRSIPLFERRSALGTWLTRILLHCSYDLLRTRRQEEPFAPQAEYGKGATGARLTDEHTDESRFLVSRCAPHNHDEVLDVRSALKELPCDDRTVLTLFYLNDYPIRQVAAVLGISEGAVKTRLSRARNRFRAVYGNEDRCNESEVI